MERDSGVVVTIRRLGVAFVLLVAVAGVAMPADSADSRAGVGDRHVEQSVSGGSSAPSEQSNLEGQPDPAGEVGFDVPVDPDEIVMEARLAPNGSARWAVEYHVELGGNDTAAFEAVSERIGEQPDRYRRRFGEGLAETVVAARNDTGREMRIEKLIVRTERRQLPQSTGVIVYEFRWVGFAAAGAEGEQLVVGDALDHMYVDDRATLTLAPPSGYEPQSVRPAPDRQDDGIVEWTGPTNFGRGEPRVTFVPAESGLEPPSLTRIGLASGVLAALMAGWLTVRGWVFRPDSDTADVESDAGEPGAGTGGTADGNRTAAKAVASDEEDGSAIPEELLSNEEQVLRTLDEHGGRMKQQALADEHDWTDSKTSKVVGELREDDAVEVFRIGRENVLTLPEVSIDRDQ